ncbi:hypothetical protein RvY_05964-2 [Ramazzottius varieornatus]|uniref:Phosphatidic acid phosphatase type 2/haloperoxidase domain-containing protein n=1 Tax=Ramazzottius varieornatus TaxID=947166 RepID=A0A1D1V3E6_RAMVA|nr:hypothetical protein RvY_05964-2 [Ramazzottius varieornatus]
MEPLRAVLQLLSSDEIVSQFQTLCGLERVPPYENPNYQGDHPSSPKSNKPPSSPRDAFLKGDKGIDSIFAAVDRESGFESQEDLVERHIRHLNINKKPSNNSTPNQGDGRIVPKTPSASSPPSPVTGKYPSERTNGTGTASTAPAYRIRYRLLYYIFRFGSSLGYEAFYATFFPIWTWNIDGAVCRRVVTMWVLTMYIGQVLKDILKLSRPSPKVVIQMEPMYVSEYGMPSTHAMVGFSVPFSLLYFCGQRYDVSEHGVLFHHPLIESCNKIFLYVL